MTTELDRKIDAVKKEYGSSHGKNIIQELSIPDVSCRQLYL